jgi:hypothetical protein
LRAHDGFLLPGVSTEPPRGRVPARRAVRPAPLLACSVPPCSPPTFTHFAAPPERRLEDGGSRAQALSEPEPPWSEPSRTLDVVGGRGVLPPPGVTCLRGRRGRSRAGWLNRRWNRPGPPSGDRHWTSPMRCFGARWTEGALQEFPANPRAGRLPTHVASSAQWSRQGVTGTLKVSATMPGSTSLASRFPVPTTPTNTTLP